MFNDIFEYYYVVPIFSFLLIALTVAINNWGITPIEYKLMTNFKKVQVVGSTILIETIVLSVFWITVSFAFGSIEGMLKDNELENNTMNIIMIMLGIVILSFCMTIAINFSNFIGKEILIMKYLYYVNLQDSKEKWYLERKSSQNKILLSNNKGEFLFVSEWENLIFKTETKSLNKMQKFIFSSERKTHIISLILIGVIVILYIIAIKVDLNTIGNFILLFGNVFLISVFIWLDKARRIVYG
ncbi:hypothetical protein QUF56_09435 [Ureibacillus composti]|nr:hypothetical protein [Ureibacillus composti]